MPKLKKVNAELEFALSAREMVPDEMCRSVSQLGQCASWKRLVRGSVLSSAGRRRSRVPTA